MQSLDTSLPINRKSQVLIVEDEVILAHLLEDELKSSGFEVVGIAATEDEALNLFHNKRPALGVVDVHLRRGTGITVAKAMEAAGAAVLFTTAHCHDLVVKSGVGLACLEKPFPISQVVTALHAVCEMSRSGAVPDWAPPAFIPLLRNPD
jgi:two-component system, response regulator PdtaR